MNVINTADRCRTSPCIPSRSSSRASSRGAFTLIELLVVVGIIVLLAGLLLPMLYRTFRTASKTRLAADLNTIGTALDAYKADFGDYPRVTTPGTGFAVLGKALIGPYDAAVTASFQEPTAPYKAGMVSNTSGQQVAMRDTGNAPGGGDWANFGFTDGADGPGVRIRPQGKVTPPYLPADKFKRQGLALLDHNGTPIMYFPASQVKINLNQAAGGFYISSQALVPGMSANERSMFNFDDNGTLALSLTADVAPSAQKTLAQMQAMMGLRTFGNPGVLPQGKQPIAVPYLLWSAGADGFFGTMEDLTAGLDAQGVDRAVRKSDDVANIPLPQ